MGDDQTCRLPQRIPTQRIVIVGNYDSDDLRAALQGGLCEFVVKENLLEVRRVLEQES